MAATLTYGLALTPRLTRLLASVFTVETVADYLHIAYDAAKKLEQS